MHSASRAIRRLRASEGEHWRPQLGRRGRLLWVLPSSHKNYLQAVAHDGNTGSLQRQEAVRVQLGNFTFIGK